MGTLETRGPGNSQSDHSARSGSTTFASRRDPVGMINLAQAEMMHSFQTALACAEPTPVDL